MRHRIFTGPFVALEDRFIQEIAALQSVDPLAPVAILVGSNVLASYLKYRIAERGRAAANFRFYTFLDLARRLGSPSPREVQKPRLPRLGATILLEEILRTQGPKVFEKVSAFEGFRGALLDTFRDLRDAGVRPHELAGSIHEIAKTRRDRAEHLEGVAILYELFRQKVTLFRDVDDDFRAAITNSDRATEILGCSHLLIYGIYDVTGQQADLFWGLRNSLNLFYFIPYVNASASGFAERFVKERARELGVDAESLPTAASPAILEVFSDPRMGSKLPRRREPQGPQPSGSFSLILVPGESRAAVEIAREMLRAIRDGIITGFHDAAIFLRHPQDEMPVLAEAFRLRKIPFFVHGGMPLSQRPFSKALMAIATLEADSFSRPSVLRVMELIAAALPRGYAEVWDAPGWRALSNDPRFLSGVESWEKGTESLISEAERELQQAEASSKNPSEVIDEDAEGRSISVSDARQHIKAARALRAGWSELRQAAADWPESLSWKEWVDLLQRRLRPILGHSDEWQIFSAILDELDGLSEVTGSAGMEHGIGRDQLTAALEESLAASSHQEGRFLRNGVNILSIAASRGLRFPLVIVPGLDEGKFPARLRQDPILLDEERGQIGNPSRLPQKSLRGEEEKLLFDMATRAAEKRLVLVSSRLDENSDRERIPSDFFLRAAGAARGDIVGYDELREDIVPGLRTVRLDSPAPPRGEVVVDEAEIRLRLVVTHPRSDRVLEALAEVEPERLGRPRTFGQARWKRALTEFDGRLRDPELARWVAGTVGASAGAVSASRLEEYGKCPYLFFLKRVMGLQKWEEVEISEGMDPLDRGLVVHKILETFMRDHAGDMLLHTAHADLVESLELIARNHLESATPPGIPDLLWEIERDRVLEMLRNWLNEEFERLDQGLLPTYFEHPFGDFSPSERGPVLRIQAGKYVFEFRGKIDRVDLSRDGRQARVLDYKVSRVPETMARKSRTPLMGGEKLQLAVYSRALSVLPHLSAVEQVQGEYLFLQVRDGRTVPCTFDPEALSKAMQRLPEILEIIGEGIENGAFFARTRGSVRRDGHCDFCEFLTICGKDRIQREERKKEDPAVRRFEQMGIMDGNLVEEE